MINIIAAAFQLDICIGSVIIVAGIASALVLAAVIFGGAREVSDE